jgi:DNA replication protein DnaC
MSTKSHWFHGKSKEWQAEYIKAHPNSVYAKKKPKIGRASEEVRAMQRRAREEARQAREAHHASTIKTRSKEAKRAAHELKKEFEKAKTNGSSKKKVRMLNRARRVATRTHIAAEHGHY